MLDIAYGTLTNNVCYDRSQNSVFSIWQLYRFAIFPLLNIQTKAYIFFADAMLLYSVFVV